MKKVATLFFAAVLTLSLVGCGSNKPAEESKVSEESVSAGENESEEMSTAAEESEKMEKKDLIVFAAASMTESLGEVKKLYEEANPNVNVVLNLDSSGTLKSQISEGADADVFISASSKQMNELDKEKDTYNANAAIDSATRFDLLENQVTLAVKEDSNKGITSFEDINTDKVETIALGNADVPVGQYSEELLKKMDMWEAIQGKISFASNVKEVTAWVSEGAVDCGIIYSTDAKAAGLKIIDSADSDMFEKKIIYPAAMVEGSKNSEEAKKFLDFLKSDQAKAVFDKYGFKTH